MIVADALTAKIQDLTMEIYELREELANRNEQR